MHPVIKIVSFLVIALFLTRAQLYGIALTLVVLAFLYIRGIHFNLQSTWRMLRRMRWLFFSILVTYLWFTPGVPLVPFLEKYSPTAEGAAGGLLRIATLSLIVIQVGLLLHTTSREELVGAIRWLAAPLSIVGLDKNRLALRIVLILDSVDEIQILLRQQMAEFSANGKRISRIAHAVGALFKAVATRAEAAPLYPITVAEQEWPPSVQWLYPIILVFLFSLGFCL